MAMKFLRRIGGDWWWRRSTLVFFLFIFSLLFSFSTLFSPVLSLFLLCIPSLSLLCCLSPLSLSVPPSVALDPVVPALWDEGMKTMVIPVVSGLFSAWFFFFCLSLFSLCAHCFLWFYPPHLLFASVLKEKRITLVAGTCCLQLQTKMTVWKGCSTNTASSPPVFSSVSFFSSFLSVPPLAFIARGCRRFLVTAGVHHGGEGCQPREVPPDWDGSPVAAKMPPLPLLPSRLLLRRQWIVLQETAPF